MQFLSPNLRVFHSLTSKNLRRVKLGNHSLCCKYITAAEEFGCFVLTPSGLIVHMAWTSQWVCNVVLICIFHLVIWRASEDEILSLWTQQILVVGVIPNLLGLLHISSVCLWFECVLLWLHRQMNCGEHGRLSCWLFIDYKVQLSNPFIWNKP